MDLYVAGQYDIVKAKLSNAGFALGQSTPDYTLNDLKHAGDFSMIREKESRSSFYREIGSKDTDRWFFSMTSTPCCEAGGSERVTNIRFEYVDRGAADTYRQFGVWWKDWIKPSGLACSSDRVCTEFSTRWAEKGRNILQDAGTQQMDNYLTCTLQMSDHPVVWPGRPPSPQEFLLGNVQQRTLYRPIPVAKRPVAKRPVSRTTAHK